MNFIYCEANVYIHVKQFISSSLFQVLHVLYIIFCLYGNHMHIHDAIENPAKAGG